MKWGFFNFLGLDGYREIYKGKVRLVTWVSMQYLVCVREVKENWLEVLSGIEVKELCLLSYYESRTKHSGV